MASLFYCIECGTCARPNQKYCDQCTHKIIDELEQRVGVLEEALREIAAGEYMDLSDARGIAEAVLEGE